MERIMFPVVWSVLRGPCLASCAMCLLLLGWIPKGSAEPKHIYPTRVVDLHAEAQHRAGDGCLKVRGITQANGRWAALIQCPAGKAVLVSGDLISESSAVLQGTFDKIIMDGDHRIVLRRSPRGKPGTEGVVVDATGTVLDSIRLPIVAEPLLADGIVKWRTRGSVRTAGEWGSIGNGVELPNVDTTVPEDIVLGLPTGEHLTLGSFTEQITLFDIDNSVIGTYKINLDAVYKDIGLAVFKPDADSGRTRIIWAVASRSGQIFLCLSDTPMSGPAYVAIVDPRSGNVTEVERAELPKVNGRKQAPHNTEGTIVPTLGAVGDRLVIVDPEMQIAVIY